MESSVKVHDLLRSGFVAGALGLASVACWAQGRQLPDAGVGVIAQRACAGALHFRA